ncbi:MAG: hypothetical protein RLZZ210_990 [Pseudomonadota bacterium]|jgi:hypothetical protein
MGKDGKQEKDLSKSHTPYSIFMPIIFGIVYGLIMRLYFGFDIDKSKITSEVMLYSFVCIMPFALGASVIFIAEKYRKRSWSYYIFAPWFAMLLFLLSSFVLLLEGAICIMIISPLLLAISSLGGLFAGCINRYVRKYKYTLHSFALLPLLASSIEIKFYNHEKPRQVVSEQRIIINASTDKVWKLINNIRDIKPNEVENGLVYKIGVPAPLFGITIKNADGSYTRKSAWHKNVKFDEIITNYHENQIIKWHYAFNSESFPKNALDDHVVIGGKYFNLQDTEYNLKAVGNNKTELSLKFSYTVNTNFNFYALPIGKIILDDFSKTILNMYKNRLET